MSNILQKITKKHLLTFIGVGLFAVLTVVGLVFYFNFRTEKFLQSNLPAEKESDGITKINTLNYQIYTDKTGIRWEKFGKYEVAEKDEYIFIRYIDTYKDLFKIDKRRFIEFTKKIPLAIRLGVEVESIELEEREDGIIEYLAVNDKLGKLYVFVDIPEFRGVTGNASWDLLESDLNGNNIILTGVRSGGKRVQNFKFSPQKKSLGYITDWNFGGAGLVNKRELVLYDLVDKKTYIISPPRNVKEYIQVNNIPIPKADIINNLIGEYKWIDEETIEFIRYFAEGFKKISPEEIWRYNLDTEEYTFIISELN